MMIRGLRLGLALITPTLRRLESSVWGGLSVFMYRKRVNRRACHEWDTTSINISAVCVVQIWFDQGKIRQYVAMPSRSFCSSQTQVTAHFYPMELLPEPSEENQKNLSKSDFVRTSRSHSVSGAHVLADIVPLSGNRKSERMVGQIRNQSLVDSLSSVVSAFLSCKDPSSNLVYLPSMFTVFLSSVREFNLAAARRFCLASFLS